jgi:regulator of replication initiation timing
MVEISEKDLQKLKDTLAKKFMQVKRLHEENQTLKERVHELSCENNKLWQRLDRQGIEVEAITKPKTRRQFWKGPRENSTDADAA